MPKYGDIVHVRLTEYGQTEKLYFKAEINGKWWCSHYNEDMVKSLPYLPVNATT